MRRRSIPSEPALDDETTADVAIVGGGFTGPLDSDRAEAARAPGWTCSCSRRSAAASARADGTAAFSTATGRACRGSRDLLGGDGALAIARASDGASRGRARARTMTCGSAKAGCCAVSTAAAHDRNRRPGWQLAARARRRGRGSPAEPRRGAARCRSPLFRRGVFYRDGATVQPARLVRALRRAALAAGVRLHERTPPSRGRATGARDGPRRRARARRSSSRRTRGARVGGRSAGC